VTLNVWMHCRLLNSHTLTVWSEMLETQCWLSGEKATFRTHEACPDKVPATFACYLQQFTHISTNKKDFQLSLFHALSMKARTYKSVQSKLYNTLQKTEGPSQTYHQSILCLCTGYPLKRNCCITNKRKSTCSKINWKIRVISCVK